MDEIKIHLIPWLRFMHGNTFLIEQFANNKNTSLTGFARLISLIFSAKYHFRQAFTLYKICMYSLPHKKFSTNHTNIQGDCYVEKVPNLGVLPAGPPPIQNGLLLVCTHWLHL